MHASELRGIAKEFASLGYPQITYEYLASWVYFHELAHTDIASPEAVAMKNNARSCSAVLAYDSSSTLANRPLLHMGNMDQSPEAVRNITLRLTFFRSGNAEFGGSPASSPSQSPFSTRISPTSPSPHQKQILFEGVDWYWFTTGVTRAVKKGFVSVQENWRSDGVLRAETVLADIEHGIIPQVLLFRQLMMDAGNFTKNSASAKPGMLQAPNINDTSAGISFVHSDAKEQVLMQYNFSSVVEYLATVQLAAPFYIIMTGAGPDGDGVVITRGRSSPVGPIVRLSEVVTHDEWFIAQTNYDRDKPDPPTDPRRTVRILFERLYKSVQQSRGFTI